MMHAAPIPSTKTSPRTSHRLVEVPAVASTMVVPARTRKPVTISRRGPIFGNRRATTWEVIPMATASGNVDNPELIGERPRPSCR